MSTTHGSTEYGNFDILWKGALRALLEEDDENVESHHDFEMDKSQTSGDVNILNDSASSLSQDSPLKPSRRNKAKRIESDSEDDGIATTEDLDVAAMLDSDSDLEFVSEERRPPHPTNTAALRHRFCDSLDDSLEEMTSCQNNDTVISRLPDLSMQTEFKKPTLPLNPKYFAGRPGLRPRKKTNKSTQPNNSQSSDSSIIFQSPSERRVPISIEEELIGEANVYSSEDEEEYEQRVTGALIEREAQCSDEEEEDEDGELEESFINDQTIMSQQLSQDSMQGVYLQSITETWW